MIASLFALFTFVAFASACTGINCAGYLDRIRLPPGFDIQYYVPHVVGARSLFLSPANILYISTRTNGGAVYAALDRNGDNVAEEVITILNGVNTPNGIAFRDGNLWVVEMTRILRFNGIDEAIISTGRAPTPVVVRTDLPRQGNHGWRYAAFNPDESDPYLYVAIGADCNICEVDGIFGTIARLDTSNGGVGEWEVVSYGVRNSVGFSWHPITGEMWFTDNGRDNWGNDIPGDELNRVANNVIGLHYGFPYCYEKNLVDDEYNTIGNCNPYVPAAQVLGPHVAALGNVFYTGNNFPQSEYYLNLFIAEHGSWNRDIPIGYRVTLVKMNAQGTGPTSYTVFAEGWLPDGAIIGNQAFGRPVDIKQLKDGSLVLSDDKNNCVYRIVYTGKERQQQGEAQNGNVPEGEAQNGREEEEGEEEEGHHGNNLRKYLTMAGGILIGLGTLFIVIGAYILRKRRSCNGCQCQSKACQPQQPQKQQKQVNDEDQEDELKAMLKDEDSK